MMKKWMAAMLAVMMLLSLVGCGATEKTETPVEDALTQDVPQDTPVAQNGIMVTATVKNNEELDHFVRYFLAGLPAMYVKTTELNGEEITYTLMFDGGMGTEGTLRTTYGGERTERTVQIALVSEYERHMYNGTLDAYGYIQSLSELDMYPFFNAKPYQTIYGLYGLYVVDETGFFYVLDYWIDENAVAYVDMMESAAMMQ